MKEHYSAFGIYISTYGKYHFVAKLYFYLMNVVNTHIVSYSPTYIIEEWFTQWGIKPLNLNLYMPCAIPTSMAQWAYTGL